MLSPTYCFSRLALLLTILASATAAPACSNSTVNDELDDVVLVGDQVKLSVPSFCESYSCRAELLSKPRPPTVAIALSEQLLACAKPSAPGSYDFVEFIVSGLNPLTRDEWWPWMLQALAVLHVPRESVAGFTYFPFQSDVKFYMALRPGSNETGKLTTGSLGAAFSGQSMSYWSPTSTKATVHSIQISPMTVAENPISEARGELHVMKVLASLFLVYCVVALIAYEFGPDWFRTLVFCWPQVCEGKGCWPYRIVLAPVVLVFNALRIYCVPCCMSYLAWMGHSRLCTQCLWHEFTDPDFPPDNRSVGKVEGDAASGIMNAGGVEWAKARAIAGASGNTPHLFADAIEPADVLQGALGDCWLMAALACVAERPDVLEQAIVTKHVDPRGKYHFRLWNQVRNSPGKKWVEVVIDENIPVHPGSLKPKFARTHCNEMWVLLLEKAFAKLYGGYDRLDGGQMSWALTAITGNPAVTLTRDPPKRDGWSDGRETVSNDQLFILLHKMRRNGAFVCCAMIEPQEKMGLIDGHAYSIIQFHKVRRGAFSTSFFRMVQIRNPHGQTEWQGAWSDRNRAWSDYPHVHQQLYGTSQRVEDGAFWMQWEDFVKFWKEVQIVDCGVNIRSIAPPNMTSLALLGPVVSCALGCFDYWCCCLGFRRLYFGREATDVLLKMEEGMDSQVGCDQEGCFCDVLDRKTTLVHGDEHLSDDDNEFSPLCPWTSTCKQQSAGGNGHMKGRTLSRGPW